MREGIKEEFPIFTPLGKGPSLVYLDNAATTQKPASVIDALVRFYTESNGNVHRGVYGLSEEATFLYEKARKKVASFVGASSHRSIVFTRGTTESINLVAHSWLNGRLKKGDRILLTELEHHSNIIPWQIAARKSGARLSYIPVTREGEPDLEALKKELENPVGILAVTAISNVLGVVNPLEKIIPLAHAKGVKVLVDGAQSVARKETDVAKTGCDFFAFSGHKMYGPTGIGVLYAKPERLEEMEPFMGGGGMIEQVREQESSWAAYPWKFEAGTPPIAEAVGLSAAIDFISRQGMETIRRHERLLVDYGVKSLARTEGVVLYGPPLGKDRAGVISFNLEGLHPHDVAQFLDDEGVALRAGHHCAQLLMKRLGTEATLRLSFSLYNDLTDVDRLIAGLEKVKKIGL